MLKYWNLSKDDQKKSGKRKRKFFVRGFFFGKNRSGWGWKFLTGCLKAKGFFWIWEKKTLKNWQNSFLRLIFIFKGKTFFKMKEKMRKRLLILKGKSLFHFKKFSFSIFLETNFWPFCFLKKSNCPSMKIQLSLFCILPHELFQTKFKFSVVEMRIIFRVQSINFWSDQMSPNYHSKEFLNLWNSMSRSHPILHKSTWVSQTKTQLDSNAEGFSIQFLRRKKVQQYDVLLNSLPIWKIKLKVKFWAFF